MIRKKEGVFKNQKEYSNQDYKNFHEKKGRFLLKKIRMFERMRVV